LKSASVGNLAGHIDIAGTTDPNIESDIVPCTARLDYPQQLAAASVLGQKDIRPTLGR
jgi:hypothetical protein